MKENNKTHSVSAFRNVFFGLIYQLTNTVVNIIIPPLLIAKFGSSVNGLVSAIRDLIKYAQLVGAGISSAAMQALYRPIHENENKKIANMFNAIRYSFIKSGLYFSLAVFIISIVYPFIVTPDNYAFTMFLVLILGLAGVTEFFLLGKFRTVLNAYQKGYIIYLSQSISALLNLLLVIIAIRVFNNVLIVQFISMTVYLLRVIIPYFYVKRKYKFLFLSKDKDDSALENRKSVIIHTLMGTLTLSSQTIIISMFLSLDLASVYAVYNLVFYGLFSIISSFTNSLTPSVGSYMVSRSEKQVTSFYYTYTFIFQTILFSVFSTAFIMFPEFLEIYLVDVDINYYDPLILTLFTISFLLNTIRIPSITYVNASGHFKQTRNGAIVEALISILLQLVLVNFYGIVGILIGTIAALLYRSFELLIYTNGKIITSSRKIVYVRILVNFTLVFILLQFNNTLDVFGLQEVTYISWILKGSISFVSVFLSYLFINILLDIKEIKNTLQIIKNLISNLKNKFKR